MTTRVSLFIISHTTLWNTRESFRAESETDIETRAPARPSALSTLVDSHSKMYPMFQNAGVSVPAHPRFQNTVVF